MPQNILSLSCFVYVFVVFGGNYSYVQVKIGNTIEEKIEQPAK